MTYDDDILPEQERKYNEWIAAARAKAIELGRQRVFVTSDDIHTACPIPAGIDPRVMGAVFLPRMSWKKIGYQQSGRRENHGRPIAQWMFLETA